jgi:hypothetical protein
MFKLLICWVSSVGLIFAIIALLPSSPSKSAATSSQAGYRGLSAEEMERLNERIKRSLPTDEEVARWHRESRQENIAAQQAVVTAAGNLCRFLDEHRRPSRNCWRELADEQRKLSLMPLP